MTQDDQNVEEILNEAFRPVEPPPNLSDRIEGTLSAVTVAAASELGEWADELGEGELGALRDPRNWVRPVVALTAGGLATGALVVLEMRRRAREERRFFDRYFLDRFH